MITLPGILQWVERLASPHLTTMENTITGAAVIENWTKTGGIPATLKGGSDYGWIYPPMMAEIKSWVLDVGLAITLNIHGTEIPVVFNQSGPPVEADLLFPVGASDAKRAYNNVVLRFYST